MTSNIELRDYFAGQALTGMLSHPKTELDDDDLVHRMLEVYKIADAMLAARKVNDKFTEPGPY
jgi:hypothetical protein